MKVFETSPACFYQYQFIKHLLVCHLTNQNFFSPYKCISTKIIWTKLWLLFGLIRLLLKPITSLSQEFFFFYILFVIRIKDFSILMPSHDTVLTNIARNTCMQPYVKRENIIIYNTCIFFRSSRVSCDMIPTEIIPKFRNQ